MQTVTNTEQAKAVLVARALTYGHNWGALDQITEALTEVGLGDYLPATGTTYKVSTAALFEAIGETFTIKIDQGWNPSQTNDLHTQMCAMVRAWARNVNDGNWTVDAPSDKVVDIDACVREFGARGTLPPVDPSVAEEVKALWQDLINKALDWAGDYDKTCDTFETIVRSIGFGEFLPPTEVTVNASWRGVDLGTVTVLTDRRGNPRPDRLLRAVRLHIERAHEDITYTPVTEELTPTGV